MAAALRAWARRSTVTAAVETAVGLFVLLDVTLLAGVHALEGLCHPSVLLGLALGVEGAFSRVAREGRWDDPARPHRYHLAPVPSGWLTRRLEVWPAEPADPQPDGGQSSTKV